MLDPRDLTHAQLATIVADIQAILWQESRMLPDFPREYGEYWNPAKEWEAETVEEIADVLTDFRPPDFMPVDLAAQPARPTVMDLSDANPKKDRASIFYLTAPHRHLAYPEITFSRHSTVVDDGEQSLLVPPQPVQFQPIRRRPPP